MTLRLVLGAFGHHVRGLGLAATLWKDHIEEERKACVFPTNPTLSCLSPTLSFPAQGSDM